MEGKKLGLRVKTGRGTPALILVAIVSLIIGALITARLDWTNVTSAGSFWKEGAVNKAPSNASASNMPSFVELAKNLSHVVVNISTTQVIKEKQFAPFPEFRGPLDDFFNDDFNKFFNETPKREFKRQSLGSGFLINKEGYILTNQHVIENATEIIVTFSADKKEYKAKVIGQDQKLDVALIKIKSAEDLPVAVVGNSDDLQIGEWVLAIGNPFGLGGTVTAGIVSQKGRVIGAGPYDNFIQTDASINPGNSGGPLFNMRGEVVGINTAIVAGGQGIGFASPINMVKEVLVQLKDKGKITRGWIGVAVQELTPDIAAKFGLKDSKGVLISSVTPGDPAEQAGMKVGDVLTMFDGRPMEELSDLPRTVAATPPGKTVEVRVVRDGKEKTFSLKVGTKAEDEIVEASSGEDKGAGESADKRFGLAVQPMTPELAKRLGMKDITGMFIASVRAESPAAFAGLRRGDVIKEIDKAPVTTLKEFNHALAGLEKKDTALFLVLRGKTTIFIIVKLNKD
ncbi:MAG: DegQ family serine endoprotease [Deltaproteobacteria bacterium]|nr:DegQ family serine endoprotease [Deltaproteobacteria bacterium]